MYPGLTFYAIVEDDDLFVFWSYYVANLFL